jgi:hypothetical protein
MGFPSCVLRTYDKNVFYLTQSLGVLQIYDKNVFFFSSFKFILLSGQVLTLFMVLYVCVCKSLLTDIKVIFCVIHVFRSKQYLHS